MIPRQDTVQIFSTFIQFNYDRFGGWTTDSRLRRSMKKSLEKIPQKRSEDFWASYWYDIWKKEPQSLAKQHLTAYFQEVCYWSAIKTIDGFSSTQYTVSDCFQVAMAKIDKVLKGFDRERGFNLKSYASITFGNLIRELLRQKREIDICSDWSLLRKLSQKRMTEALVGAGLDERVVETDILAWNCFKAIYVPEKGNSPRKLPKPERETWVKIANLYNQERQSQLGVSGDTVTPEQMEKRMLVCAKAARSYLFPTVTSINQQKPGYDSGEIVDSIVGEIDDPLLTDMIADEETQQRNQQQSNINQLLTATLQNLKPEEQKVLELYYSQNLKQAEIANELNTQQYTISRKLSKTRKTLLKSLAVWSKDTMHISLTADVLNNLTSLLEEWLNTSYPQMPEAGSQQEQIDAKLNTQKKLEEELVSSHKEFKTIERYTAIIFPSECGLQHTVDLRIKLAEQTPLQTRVLQKVSIPTELKTKIIKLNVHITAPGFFISHKFKSLFLPVNGDSEEVIFKLVAVDLGRQVVEIEFFHECTRVGYALVETQVKDSV